MKDYVLEITPAKVKTAGIAVAALAVVSMIIQSCTAPAPVVSEFSSDGSADSAFVCTSTFIEGEVKSYWETFNNAYALVLYTDASSNAKKQTKLLASELGERKDLMEHCLKHADSKALDTYYSYEDEFVLPKAAWKDLFGKTARERKAQLSRK